MATEKMRHKTPEDYHALAEARGFAWLGPEVRTTHTKTGWQCEKGHQWDAPFSGIQSGRGCPYCSNRVPKTEADYHTLAEERGFKWLGPMVKNTRAKTEWECPNGHRWFSKYENMKWAQRGCPICAQEQGKGGRTLTQEQFIERAIAVHGDRFNYSKVKYVNSATKVLIGCENGHWFEQTPSSHIHQGSGCPRCQGIRNTEDFIEKARSIHGDYYDYSMVRYQRGTLPVIIICKEHGMFYQRAANHLMGQGCAGCKGGVRSNTEEFIEKATELWGDRYDLSLVKYKRAQSKVTIICKKHGKFRITPNDFLNERGCPACGLESTAKKLSSSTTEFIQKARAIHKGRYDYGHVKYKNNHTKVIIICNQHGQFRQTPQIHLTGAGCPACNSSTGEERVAEILDNLGINYRREVRLKGCRGKSRRPLFFDFCLNLNGDIALIEYDGQQHFESITHFGGRKNLKITQANDAIKNKYTAQHNIPLLRIPYWDFERIEEIVIKWLDTFK